MTKEMRELAKGQAKSAKNSKSRITGVHFDKRMRKWRAEIYKDGKTIPLGTFEDKAVMARVEDFKQYGCRSRGRSKK